MSCSSILRCFGGHTEEERMDSLLSLKSLAIQIFARLGVFASKRFHPFRRPKWPRSRFLRCRHQIIIFFCAHSTRCHPVATTRCTSCCTLCYHDYIYASSRLHAAHFSFIIIIIIILFLVEAELRKQQPRQQQRCLHYYPRCSDTAECSACKPAPGLRQRMLQQTRTSRSPPRHDKAAG